MKISAWTIFFTSAVFSDNIGSISSTEPPEVTLAQLFPEYELSGFLPSISIVQNPTATNNRNFRNVGSHIMSATHHLFAARDHVIFAYRGFDTFYDFVEGDYVQPLYKLFPTLGHQERWVFDTTRKRWVSLNKTEFKKLGFGYIWNLVGAQEKIAATHRLTTETTNEEDERAHNYAYSEANYKMEEEQVAQAEKIRVHGQTVRWGMKTIRKSYVREYNLAFADFKHRHG